MEYANLEQRMAYAYLAVLPAFVPKENSEVTIAEQKVFYDLMKNLYRLLFDDPSLIVPALHEDDAFPTRYKSGYGKPDLQVNMQKYRRAVDGLLQNMLLAGQGAGVKLSRRQQKILSALGIDDLTKLPPAWVWMANRPGASQAAFAYCLFDENHVYSAEVYARLLGEKAFFRLEKWMTAHGYKAYDITNVTASDCKLLLTYANPAWGAERPRGGFEYKIRHTGISAQYDAYTRNPVSIGACIPHGLKLFLEHFDSMSPQVKTFVLSCTKKCDGCRYCVQTDKTGKRPLACIPIAHEQTTYRLCPYFPGYSYSWTSMDDALAENITAFLSFMDGFAEGAV